MSGETKGDKAANKAPLGIVHDERGQVQPADKKAAQTAGKPAKDNKRLGLLEGWRAGMRFVSEVPLMRVVLSLSVLEMIVTLPRL